MDEGPAPAPKTTRTAVAVASLALLALGCVEVWPWIADDTFISLRYAARLLDGHGLTWNDGERVEGYSNLLWVLLVAALHGVGVEWIAAVRVLGAAAAVALLAVLLGSRVLPAARGGAQLAVVPVVFALSPLAAWTIGGLEIVLVLALLAAALAALVAAMRAFDAGRQRAARARLLAAGAALAGVVLARPDGPLWSAVAAATVCATVRGWRSRARLLAPLLVLPVVAFAGQLAFRLAWYGDTVPNTAHVKLGASWATAATGLGYLGHGLAAVRALAAPAAGGALCAVGAACVVGAVGARQGAPAAPQLPRPRPLAREPAVVFALVGALAWSGYLVLIGGDFLARFRLLVPLLLPLAVLAAVLLRAFAARGRAGVLLAWAVGVAGVVVARVDAARADDDPWQARTDWEWRGRTAGEFLRDAFAAQQPLLAVDAAGAVPFYSGLPCLDLLGLCDAHIARARRDDAPIVLPGHWRGDGAYVLDRAPDLVLFGQPPGSPEPRFLSGFEMEHDRRFLDGYRCVLFFTGPREVVGEGVRELTLTLWARLDGRVGVQRRAVRGPGASGASGAEERVVPGFWLGSLWQREPFDVELRRLRPLPPPSPATIAAAHAAATWWQEAAAGGVLDDDGTVVGELRRPGTFALDGLRLPPGRWTVGVEPAPAPAGVTCSLCDATGAELPRAGAAFVVVGEGTGEGAETAVRLVCRVAADATVPVRIARVVLRTQ